MVHEQTIYPDKYSWRGPSILDRVFNRNMCYPGTIKAKWADYLDLRYAEPWAMRPLDFVLRCLERSLQDDKSNYSRSDPEARNDNERPLWPKLPSPVFPLLGVPILLLGSRLLWLAMWNAHGWLFVGSYVLLLTGSLLLIRAGCKIDQ